MAGNRINGIVAFAANFEPEIGAPLDARTTVPSQADLYLALTWTANDGGIYVYNGLTVTVYADSTPADNGMYILIDAPNYTLAGSWLFVGSGGGTTYQGGDGINIDTATVPDTIEVDLGPGCGAHGPNLYFQANQLDFLGVHIQDEGFLVGTFPVINFIGVDVLSQSSADPCVVDVYIPPPTFAPYFNMASTTEMNCSQSFSTPRISIPTAEGNPFKTGSAPNTAWEGTSSKATYEATTAASQLSLTMQGGNTCTGFGGDSTITVTVYDANGTSVLVTHTTGVITADGAYGNGSTIGITITNYAADTTKWQATPAFTIDAGTILTNAALDGGRFHVMLSHTTDTGTDTGTTYYYYGPNGNTIPTSQTYNANAQDVFLDVNDLNGYPSVPIITGLTTIIQTPSGVVNTKHLSGVEYYTLGSQFEIEVKGIDDYNANTQGRTGSTQWNFRCQGTNYGLATTQLEAWNPSSGSFSAGTGIWPDGWNAQDVDFIWSNWGITVNPWRYRYFTATIDGKVYDPWDPGASVNSADAAILIDAYSATSTDMIEYFDDENQRLSRTGTYTTFSSTTTLVPSGLLQQTTSALSPGPFCDACVVGGTLVRPDKFYADYGNSPQVGTIIADLSAIAPSPQYPWIPNTGGNNPDYSIAGYQVSSTYHRLFEVSPSNANRAISSFELTFVGTFPSGTAYDELVSNNLKVYIRKYQAAVSANFGYTAVPHSLHNSVPYTAAFSDPPASVDDNSTSQCRTTTGSSNTIAGTFGTATSQAEDGFYIEIHIDDAAIKISQINCKVIFAAGSPPTQP